MYLLTGNTYINGTEAVGFQGFRELSVLPSQVTAPIVGNEITPIAGYEMQSTEIQKFSSEEVAHIKAFDPRIIGFETLIGLSPLEAAMFVYSANNEQWEAMASMLKNKGAMGIVTSRTDRGMRKDDAEDMQKQYRDTFGGGKNFGSPMFTGANVDFLQMGMSSTDLQMIEQGVLSLRAICNIYKVSSRLFNDPANSTFNNVQQAEKAMWNDAVIPLLEKFKQRYNSWLAPSFGEQYMLDYDLTGIDALQADAKTRAEVAKIHADSGSISVNEYRKLNGLELLDDESADLIPNLRENNQDNS
jgi:HK97 family phage portal protein